MRPELQICVKIVCLASALFFCFEFTGGFLFADTSTFFAPEITAVKLNKIANISKCIEARHFLETAKLLRVQREIGCAIFEAGRLSLHYFDSSTPTSDVHSYYREIACKFLQQVSSDISVSDLHGSAVFVAKDDATLPPKVVSQSKGIYKTWVPPSALI